MQLASTTTSGSPDVIIVGAGPAGTHTALHLLERGRSAVVLDKSHFPRSKPCGEFLAPECLPLLGELGLLDDTELAGAKIESMHLNGYGRSVTANFRHLEQFGRGPSHGLAVRRERLDTLALNAVRNRGGDVREGWSVTAPIFEGPRVVGVHGLRPNGETFELRAAFTVGADGLRGRIARALGPFQRVPWLDRMALSTRVPVLEDHSESKRLESGAEVHFEPGAFLAIAPVGEGEATLNVVVNRSRIHAGIDLRELVEAQIARCGDLSRRLGTLGVDRKISAIGPLAWTAKAVSAPGAALVGDACGYVDPVTGEGLYYAMRGAQILAVLLDDVLADRQSEREALHGYARQRREFAHRRFLALALQRALPRPRLAATALSILQLRPGLAHLAVGMTGRAIAPKTLLRPALWRTVLGAN